MSDYDGVGRINELEAELAALRERNAALTTELAHECGKHDLTASERDAALAKVEALEKERDAWQRLAREQGRKLAVAGVEGSPPPGTETTIGIWTARTRKAESERDAALSQVRELREALTDIRDDCEASPSDFAVGRASRALATQPRSGKNPPETPESSRPGQAKVESKPSTINPVRTAEPEGE